MMWKVLQELSVSLVFPPLLHLISQQMTFDISTNDNTNEIRLYDLLDTHPHAMDLPVEIIKYKFHLKLFQH